MAERRSPRPDALAPSSTLLGEPRVVGPGFNARVYDVVRRVPEGRVTTYGDVATVLGSPRVARHVGWALAALDAPDVPWHRVINAQGCISFRGDVGRGETQRRRLLAEGVVFDARGRVDLRRYRFDYGTGGPARGRPAKAAPRAKAATASAPTKKGRAIVRGVTGSRPRAKR